MKSSKHRIRTLALGLSMALFAFSEILSSAQPQLTLAQLASLTPMNPAAMPKYGTFWLLNGPNPRNPTPPLPIFPDNLIGLNLPVYQVGDGQFLIDDSSVDYNALEAQMAVDQALTVGNGPLSAGPGPDSPQPLDASFPAGSLWLQLTGISGNPPVANLVIHGTTNLTFYEIQSKQSLTDTSWTSEITLPGADAQDWTPVSVSVGVRTNQLFFRARSWADSSGNGLPDWWQLQYFGYVGIDPYADASGDGSSNLQKYQNGNNPKSCNTPPPLQSVLLAPDPTQTNALIWWTPPSITPTSFTIKNGFSGVWQTIATIPGNQTSLTITNYRSFPYPYFAASANYPCSSAPLVQAGDGNDNPNLDVAAAIVTGPAGRVYVVAERMPTGSSGLVVALNPYQSIHPKDNISSVTTRFPVTSFQPVPYGYAGLLSASNLTGAPFLVSTNCVPLHGFYLFGTYGLATNNQYGNRNTTVNQWYVEATPFMDGRQHVLDNLDFVLRTPTATQPFDFYFPGHTFFGGAGTAYGSFGTYATAGFNWKDSAGFVSPDAADPFQPFEDGSVLRAFCFDATRFDSFGNPLDTDYDTVDAKPIMNTWDHYFSSLSWAQASQTNAPARQLDATTSQYLFYGPITDGYDVPDAGLTWNGSGWNVTNNARNFFGLRVLSVRSVTVTSSPQPLTVQTATAGGTLPALGTLSQPGTGWLYVAADTPGFTNAGFHVLAGRTHQNGPGDPNWSGQNQTNTAIIPVGGQTKFYAWEKLAVTNGYPDKVAYLEQYFDQAYKVDASGAATTNQTGVLSEYGDFFPTEPGTVALTTKPDFTGGATAQVPVYVISLALDANHDGVMDTTFTGPDFTTASRPFSFWVNNDFDRVAFDTSDKTNYEDSVEAPRKPGFGGWLANTVLGWTMPPDGDYRDSGGHRTIPTTRDLEDFARLWICGINGTLQSNLPPGTTITLNWGDVGNPNTNNPAIDLFQAADLDGGIGYLTNSATAMLQTNASLCRYIGRLGPGQRLLLNDNQFTNSWAGNCFIWCGTGPGTGQLNLTITLGGTNILSQASAFIQLQDIKQMYERWTVGDNPGLAPTNKAVPVQDDIALPFQYAPPTDPTTPYILFVHGWNLDRYDKDRFAESAFKRLYWQGYQGRFGSFRWPTDYNFKGSLVQLITDPTAIYNFDRSEYQAWRSGPGLLDKLASLNAQYPGRVYVLAHSMGGIVSSEAIRLSGRTKVVNTFVATQAALSAHTYDSSIANYSFLYLPFSTSARTPNIYTNWFAGNNGGGANKVISFYNVNDYALQRSVWQLNQLKKPDSGVIQSDGSWTYSYRGSANDPPPWTNFSRYYISGGVTNTVHFDISNVPTNRYEVMSFAAESWTTALGATPAVAQVLKNVDLSLIWPPDLVHPITPFDEHFYHSGEFRGANWQQQAYWRALLSQQNGFGLQTP